MPTSVGPNTFGEENLVFGYDTGDTVNSFPGIPAVNCAPVPTSKGNWSVTEITDGSIAPPRKGARVFKFVAGTTSNLYRHSGYYGGGGFTNNNNVNPLILGRTSPSNFTTVSEANKYRWGFWVRGVESNNAGWNFYIDIGDRRSASYTVGNKTDWYFISCVNDLGIASTTYPYDFFDIFTANQGLTLYVADMGIMRSPGTVDDLPIMQAYPQWVDYGQERTYTEGLKDLTGNSTIDLTNVSFDSDAQMTFDGTTDYISIPHSAAHSFTGDFSIEIVFKPTGNTANCLIQKGSGNDYYQEYWVLCDTRNSNRSFELIMGKTGNTSANYNVNASNSATIGQYHHIVTGVEGSTGFIYVNGELIDTGDVTDRIQSTSGIRIGERVDGFADTLGDQPLTKLYNRALTASEIKANYNAIKGRFNI